MCASALVAARAGTAAGPCASVAHFGLLWARTAKLDKHVMFALAPAPACAEASARPQLIRRHASAAALCGLEHLAVISGAGSTSGIRAVLM